MKNNKPWCIIYFFVRQGQESNRVVLVTNTIPQLADWPTSYMKEHPECLWVEEMYLADLHDEAG